MSNSVATVEQIGENNNTLFHKRSVCHFVFILEIEQQITDKVTFLQHIWPLLDIVSVEIEWIFIVLSALHKHL